MSSNEFHFALANSASVQLLHQSPGTPALLQLSDYLRLRLRHETSAFHMKAYRNMGESPVVHDDLQPCKGLVLQSHDGSSTKMGEAIFLPVIRQWLEAGCPAVVNSALDTICVTLDAESHEADIRVRDAACKEAGDMQCTRGMSCCKQCFAAANRANCVKLIRQWSLRISFVDLTHIALSGNASDQVEYASWMKSLFPEVAFDDLDCMGYPSLVLKTKNLFMHIATSRQNRALQAFISRTLKFLSPTMVTGVSAEARSQVVAYVDAVACGKVLPHESEAIALRLTSSIYLVLFCFFVFLIFLFVFFQLCFDLLFFVPQCRLAHLGPQCFPDCIFSF